MLLLKVSFRLWILWGLRGDMRADVCGGLDR